MTDATSDVFCSMAFARYWLDQASPSIAAGACSSVNEVKNVPKSVRDNPGAYRSIYGGYHRYSEASNMSDFHPGYMLNAVVYALLGILIFVVAFVIVDKMTPYDLWKEIVRREAILRWPLLVGAMSIGMCIIIAGRPSRLH